MSSASAPVQPSLKTFSGFGHNLKLHWSAGQLSFSRRPVSNLTTAYNIADFYLDQIAPTELAVDREVEQGSVAKPFVLVKKEPNCPNVAWLQWAFRSDILPRTPRTPFMHSRVKV